ncbi:MAG TPA: ATP-binding protein, partial [Thermoanaerobaculia bacterium]|nr:ATP-binding protein [Thermoanaerobaculia bacterium]
MTRLSLKVLLAILLVPSAAPAGSGPELWKSQAGDDPRWARPGLNDSGWPAVPLTATWREQGRQGLDGVVWFRRVVPLDEEARLAAERDQLGLLLGRSTAGGYEAYAGGRWIGRSRGWSSALPFGFPEVFRIPREAVGKGAALSLAIRVRRVGWASDRDPQAAPTGTVFELGSYKALKDRARVAWTDKLLTELPLLVLAALFAAAGLYHLLLFSRRRKQIEHLWFGLLALVFSINTIASTYWIYEITVRRDVAVRLSDLSGHLAAALAIQFLWPFFSRPVSRPLRAYQLSHVALAGFIALWPSVRPVLASSTARWLWLLPLLVASAALIAREVWQGRAESRTIAAGGLAMVAIQGLELARNVLPLPWTLPLAAFGFAAVLVAMGIALSNRFRRVHDELDRLRLDLEAQVRERTRDLEEARDQALAASRVKSEFLANISHEIRTPMNGVLGMADLLARTDLAPHQKEYVKTIEASGRALLALINDILDFSRMESKKLTVERAPFRLEAVIEESLRMIAPLAAERGLALCSSIAPGTPEALVGDRHRTRQILLNLLSNAVKFTPAGEVRVELSARPLEDGLVEAHFAVTDTGIGIAGQDLDRLFTPFLQLDGSASRQYGGAGLGLAISQRLTGLLGGRIWVESTLGRGSTFHFTIVGEAAPASSPRAAERQPAEAGPASRPLRILLAEDQPVNQLVLLAMLESLGHRTGLANNGLEVLRALENETYDVILMDVQMPELDGLETTRR